MIHEILISLSGHPSPLFEDDLLQGEDGFLPLSPAEKSILSSIGRLSWLHRSIRHNVELIQAEHKSSICKAVASSIESTQLDRFQQKILDVEASILRRDAGRVGAYEIVPLAGIVGEFSEWHRVMEWLWEIVCLIKPMQRTELACSGPHLINKLRKSAQTGYSDIETAAVQLSRAAEGAWMRQLAEWILYGRLSRFGAIDFFVEEDQMEGSTMKTYHINQSRIPSFVTPDCATSTLFLGNALHQISLRSKDSRHTQLQAQLELLPVHQRGLSFLKLPIVSASLSDAVRSIRVSLSRNVLQKLLSLENVLQLLDTIRNFMLLQKSEFGHCLIHEADERLRSRSRQSAQHSGMKDSIRGMILKDSEVKSILAKTWTHLFNLAADNDDELDMLERSRDLLQLNIGRGSKDSKSAAGAQNGSSSKNLFNQFLLPVPTVLEVQIESPFDLFMSTAETRAYANINAYLIAIRRGHIHLTSLWKQSQIRRDHPTPLGPPRSCTEAGRRTLQHRRQRSMRRQIDMRKIWATCSAVVFLLNEVGDYIEAQVIPAMWAQLLDWIQNGTDPQHEGAEQSQDVQQIVALEPQQIASSHMTSKAQDFATRPSSSSDSASITHDPATLAEGHKVFLAALIDSILLSDTSFTTALISLLHSVDDLIAQITRLQVVQRNLDLEEDSGVFDALGDYDQELSRCKIELDRARKTTDSNSREVVARLKSVSNRGDHASKGLQQHEDGVRHVRDGAYRPLCSVKIERLLMKLEYGNQTDDADELGDGY